MYLLKFLLIPVTIIQLSKISWTGYELWCWCCTDYDSERYALSVDGLRIAILVLHGLWRWFLRFLQCHPKRNYFTKYLFFWSNWYAQTGGRATLGLTGMRTISERARAEHCTWRRIQVNTCITLDMKDLEPFGNQMRTPGHNITWSYKNAEPHLVAPRNSPARGSRARGAVV